MNKKSFTDNYLQWIKDNTVEEQLSNGWTEIATPFLDRHNDGLVIYAKEERGEITLSDDGYIIGDMELSGISVNRRMKAICSFLQGYGVTVTDNNELQIKATNHTYPVKQHLLLQAMMAASDMFSPSQTLNSGEIFFEDVIRFFEDNSIIYTQDIQFTGKSGLIHKVDFIIPKGKNTSERFVYAINHPTRSNALMTVGLWEDITKVRRQESSLMAMLNDRKEIPSEITNTFINYSAVAIPWSQRSSHINKFHVA